MTIVQIDLYKNVARELIMFWILFSAGLHMIYDLAVL